MKVYTLVVMNMTSLNVVREESYEYEGEVALCKGPSGSISYPDYMEDIHVHWLTGGTIEEPNPTLFTSLESEVQFALIPEGNPYHQETSFDPNAAVANIVDSPLSDMQLRYDSYDTLVTALDDEVDYAAFVDQAITKVDESYVTEAQITALVTTYETEVRARRLAEVSVHTAGMADINAVVGSQFVIGMALIESNITQEINRFERELRIRLREARGNLIDSAVKVMNQINLTKVDFSSSSTQLQAELSRLKIVALKEQVDRDLEIDALFASYGLEAFQFGANLLGVLGGNTMPNIKQPSTAQSVLGGAISGAAAGAKITGGNPIGIGIGALAGGLSGLF